MCGIAGAVGLEPGRPVDPGPVRAMLDALAHRGPDDEGLFASEGVALGSRRLAVIDVEGGRQPLTGREPGTVIVLNGEIYNYRELARELRGLGHRFRTRCDTEVAAHAYDAWGPDFLHRLDGMFALALWDGRLRRLLLARDRMGEKPLYYGLFDGTLLFASELTALLEHPAVPAELDLRSLSAYLALEYVPAPLSMVHGVSKLEPGSVLTLEGGRVDRRRYWTLEAHPGEPPPYEDAVRRLRSLLEEAVRSRLVSDVPLGILLSGGIDSGTVAALAAHHGTPETFSIAFDEPSFDERAYARQVAERIGSRHHQRVLRGEEMPGLVPRLAEILDEPLGDASIVPTTLLSGFARESVTVALGGDGGDELFAGYPMHRARRVAPLFRRVPRPARGALRAGARLLPVSHRDFSFGFKAGAFLRGAGERPPLDHLLWMSSFSREEQRRLLTPGAWEEAEKGRWAEEPFLRVWRESAGAPPLARSTHLDARTYLPDDILAKVDRASMSVSLEVRAPFLARELVEYAFSLPDRYRMRGLTGKRILRDAVRDLLPERVIRRPKKGFGIPVAAWLNGPLRGLARDLLHPAALGRAGLVRPEVVEGLLEAHERREADHRKPLWTLLVLELWRRRHLEGRRGAASAGRRGERARGPA